MRTSRISQETNRLINALSTSRTTRSTTNAIRAFANENASRASALRLEDHTDKSTIPTEPTTDIEDILRTSSRSSSRKRKRNDDSPATSVTTVAETSNRSTPRKRSRKTKKEETEVEVETDTREETFELEGASSPSQARAKPKIPARKTVANDGTVTIHAPSNWEEIYSIIQKMREKNPTAPVDTMGCEELYWRWSSPKDKRYHILTSLMLSSQTKDTVTAAAMQRLHTELVLQPSSASLTPQASRLTVSNILDCDPKHLDDLIGKVGFHNNKTRYIKQTAQILHAQYNSDIPSTLEGLISLPGVGPKMAYLCLSAAWGVDAGIGVDVHVHRITNLWGWHNTKTPEETRAWLEGWLPKDKWHHINKMLVGLGQTVCLPVGRKCWECDLSGTGLCKGEIRGLKIEEKRKKVRKEKVESEDRKVVTEELKLTEGMTTKDAESAKDTEVKDEVRIKDEARYEKAANVKAETDVTRSSQPSVTARPKEEGHEDKKIKSILEIDEKPEIKHERREMNANANTVQESPKDGKEVKHEHATLDGRAIKEAEIKSEIERPDQQGLAGIKREAEGKREEKEPRACFVQARNIPEHREETKYETAATDSTGVKTESADCMEEAGRQDRHGRVSVEKANATRAHSFQIWKDTIKFENTIIDSIEVKTEPASIKPERQEREPIKAERLVIKPDQNDSIPIKTEAADAKNDREDQVPVKMERADINSHQPNWTSLKPERTEFKSEREDHTPIKPEPMYVERETDSHAALKTEVIKREHEPKKEEEEEEEEREPKEMMTIMGVRPVKMEREEVGTLKREVVF